MFTYQYLGSDYEHFNRDEDAEFIYLKGLEQKADYMDILNQLQALYHKNDQYGKALEIQRRVIEIEPENVLQLANIESLYYLLGDLKQAAAYSKKVDEMAIKKRSELADLAFQYLYAKHFERADYYFKEASAIEPDHPIQYWDRCRCFSIKGEPK